MPEYQGTDVAYNGVILHNVTTRQWDQEVVYDDSGTDVIFTRYKLSFEGIVHLQSMVSSPAFIGKLVNVAANPPFVPGHTEVRGATDIAQLYQEVSRLLSQPRGNLQVMMAGKMVLTVTPTVNGVADWDVDNGPKPQNFSLDHVSGGVLFRVHWGVDVAILPCRDYNGTVSRDAVLNNRWSVDESMDANFFITRTITGKIRFSKSDINHQELKWLITYPLEHGFRRQSIQFQCDPTGLEATYTVVDKQVHTAAPWPATKISATHSESTGDGVRVFGECNVRLEGPPNADKRLMLARAFQVIDARLDVLYKTANADWLLESFAVIDYIGEENIVEVRMRIQHKGRDTYNALRLIFGGITQGQLGKPLELPNLENVGEGMPPGAEPYNSTVSQDPNLWGYHTERRDETRSAVSFILRHYLQSPCSPLYKTPFANGYAPPESEDEVWTPFVIEGPSTPLGSQVDLPQSPGDKVSQKAREAIYTHCTMENHYSLAPARVMFPLSQSLGSTGENRDSAVAISFGAGLCKREITIDVERVGELPNIPEPLDQYTDGDLRGYLLDHSISPHPPTLSPDGQKLIHRITAHYVYGLNRQPTPSEKIAIGVMPFTNLQGTDTQIAMADLYDDQLLPGTRLSPGETT